MLNSFSIFYKHMHQEQGRIRENLTKIWQGVCIRIYKEEIGNFGHNLMGKKSLQLNYFIFYLSLGGLQFLFPCQYNNYSLPHLEFLLIFLQQTAVGFSNEKQVQRRICIKSLLFIPFSIPIYHPILIHLYIYIYIYIYINQSSLS